MNPEPPPLADPHSTTHVPRPRDSGKTKNRILGALHFVAGIPLFVMGALYAGFITTDTVRLAANRYHNGMDWLVVGGCLIFCALGFTLIRHGLRLWKH